MRKRRGIALILVLMVFGVLFSSCSKDKKDEDNKKYTIGITQYVQHDALDSARKGFVDGLSEEGYKEGENIVFDYENAQGDISIAQTISNQFVSNKVDMIFAIATPSLQSAYNATNDIPIVFTAVTDPIEAGVAESWDASGTNVTGTSDMVSMDQQLNLLLSLTKDINTIGVIYNSSEANSLIQVEELKKSAEKNNVIVKEISVTNVSEINQNLSSVINSIDALYVPTDNTAASAYDLIGSICCGKNIPMLCAEEAGVSKGGLCSIGIDYYKLGKEAAAKAVEILEGGDVSNIKIDTLKDMTITINEEAAEKMNISIPDEIKDKAVFVTGGVN